MANIKTITDENFQDTVLGSEKVFVLDFFSDWCAPCKMMEPVVEELAGEYGETVNFGKMDISANTRTPTDYGVMAIPTFIIFKGGEEMKRLMGITPREKFKSEIEKIS